LIERRRLLRTTIPEHPSAVLYASRIERNCLEFIRVTFKLDLEGIPAKLKHRRYSEGWFKIRNPKYSQREGRRGLFERRRSYD
jgi:ATP-dependent DNA ligase